MWLSSQGRRSARCSLEPTSNTTSRHRGHLSGDTRRTRPSTVRRTADDSVFFASVPYAYRASRTSTYRPRAIRTNSRSFLWAPADRHQFTESLETASPSNASTARTPARPSGQPKSNGATWLSRSDQPGPPTGSPLFARANISPPSTRLGFPHRGRRRSRSTPLGQSSRRLQPCR